MSDAIIVDNTGNQAHIDFDVSKIFIFNNRYEKGTFLNASGGIKSFVPGTLLGKITASGKIIPLVSGAADGSNIPVGILLTEIKDLADAGEESVNYCIAGDVAEEKVVLDAGDNLGTVISGRTINDRIIADTMGIKLVASDELTGFDNQ